MEINEMVNLIKKCLINVCENMVSNPFNKETSWTEEIKNSLAQLGEYKGYDICTATKGKEYQSEWLYDLVWYKEDTQGFLIDVPLVVESEWGKHLVKDIKFDFEKLLLSRSYLKLMICNCQEKNRDNYLQYFQKAINVCPLVTKGDLYLIAILKLEGNDAVEFEFFEMTKQM